MTIIDRVDRAGNITQHRVNDEVPTKTMCGAKLNNGCMTQAPAGNRPCRNCFPHGVVPVETTA